MKKQKISVGEMAEKTKLNKSLFTHLDEPGGCVQKRFIVSIAVALELDGQSVFMEVNNYGR